ncbi:hypothetical protein D3C71_1775590 [compost metagenome]
MPRRFSGPKRRDTSACACSCEPEVKELVTRVSGCAVGRLVTMLTTPPTPPAGDMPLSKAPGPLSNSTRSMNSVGMLLSGAMP